MLRSVFLLAQTAPPAPPAAGQILEAFQDVFREQAGPLIIWFLLSQVVSILICWLASRVVGAGHAGTLLNALKVYLYSFLIAVIAGILLFGVARTTGSDVLVALVALAFAIVVAFTIPMKVYDFGFGRALGWLLVSALLNAIGGFAVSLAFGDVQQQLADRMTKRPGGRSAKPAVDLAADRPSASAPASPAAATPAPAAPRPTTERPQAVLTGAERSARFDAQDRIAGDKKRPLPERMAALNDLYQQLEQERVGLPPGDAGARGAFDQRRARYEGHLQRMKAEQPTPRPAR